MTTATRLKVSALAAGLFLAFGCAQAAETMTKDEYKAAKDKIEATYKAAKDACDAQKGNAKDVCVKEAKATEKIAKADLEFKHTGKESDRLKAEQVKAEQEYEVAAERCEDRSGADKSACKADAKAAEKRALASIKAEKKAKT